MRVKKQPPPALIPMMVARWASEYTQRVMPQEHAKFVFGVEPGAESRVRIARIVGSEATVLWLDLEPTQAACGPALEIALQQLLYSAHRHGMQVQLEPDVRMLWKHAVATATNEHARPPSGRVVTFKLPPSKTMAATDMVLRVVTPTSKRQCEFSIAQLNRQGFFYAEARLQRANIPFQKIEQFAAGYDFTLLADAKPQITTAEITAADAAFEEM